VGRNLLPEAIPEKSYQPCKWTGAHRRIGALEMAGCKPGEIAGLTESSISHVSVILNDRRADLDRREFARRVVEEVQDVQLKIALHADEALDEIIDEMRNEESPQVRQKAAFGILDRAGYTAVQKSVALKAELPEELLRSMGGVLEEMQEITAEYVVLEPEEVEDDLL